MTRSIDAPCSRPPPPARQRQGRSPACSPCRAGAHQPPEAAALVPIPDERDGAVRLHLPEGFQLPLVPRHRAAGDACTTAPRCPDDTTGWAPSTGRDGTYVLVRNHEVNNPAPAFGPGTPYDPMARGGTTTIQVTPHGEVVRAFTSLNGTMMNCSGGQMPWGSWVTCEETVNGPDVGPDFTSRPTSR